MSDLGAVRPPQLMGSVRWKLTEPEMGRSQTMTPPERNVSEAPGNNSRGFFQALVKKEMSVLIRGPQDCNSPQWDLKRNTGKPTNFKAYYSH